MSTRRLPAYSPDDSTPTERKADMPTTTPAADFLPSDQEYHEALARITYLGASIAVNDTLPSTRWSQLGEVDQEPYRRLVKATLIVSMPFLGACAVLGAAEALDRVLDTPAAPETPEEVVEWLKVAARNISTINNPY